MVRYIRLQAAYSLICLGTPPPPPPLSQFDLLWDGLTAVEHLCLFGAIKGIPARSVAAEADRRIEEVR